jgi:putative ECF transporter S component (TIGR02185 family)
MKRKGTQLNVRDLVLIGILTILIMVISMVISLLASPIMPIWLIINGAVNGLLLAPIFLLMVVKVGKRGTLFLTSVVRGILYALMGFPHMLLLLLPLGLVGEGILYPAENYRKVTRSSLAWIIYTSLFSLHGALLLWIFGSQLFGQSLSLRFSPEQLALMNIYYFNPLIVIGILLLSAVGAALGSGMGWKLLKKHFIKAGFVQAESL